MKPTRSMGDQTVADQTLSAATGGASARAGTKNLAGSLASRVSPTGWERLPVLTLVLTPVLMPVLMLMGNAHAVAQTGWHGGRQWRVRRRIRLNWTPRSDQDVCVLDCFSDGEMNRDHPGLVVICRRQPVPFRVLQRGPGDVLRVAFQTRTKATRYEIYYGGSNRSPPPKWTSRNGLLLETRRFHDGNLFRLSDVRAQFDRSEPLDADYVPNVFLGRLSFTASTTPVLTRFTGFLHIQNPGRYRLYTSSRDASWILIDGKQVLSWPGRHGPTGQGRYFKDVPLSRGLHRFEYHHAATGHGITAVAAWKHPGAKKITPIPPEAFGVVRRVTTERLEIRSGGSRPDFSVVSLAEAPLGKGRPPLVKVRFVTHPMRTSLRWDFGDGVVSTSANPEHIYLRPGLYTVRCRRSGSRTGTIRQVPIDPPWNRLGEKGATADIADWLPALREYQPARMSANDLKQLVAVYRELGDQKSAVQVGVKGIESRRTGSPPLDPQETAVLAESLAELLDDALDQPEEAIRICELVLTMKPQGEPLLRLHLAAARSALSADRIIDCRRHLTAAATLENKNTGKQTRRRLASLRGDLNRRRHKASPARAAYKQAVALSPSRGWDEPRRIAMIGVYVHDIEEALRSANLAKAGTLLRRWEEDLPSCKRDGYYAVLRSRYELARRHYRTAIQESEDALGIAADSPYADRLLLVLAEAQARLARVAPSQAALRRLINDYPGSPLIRTARKRLAGGFPEQTKPSARKKHSKSGTHKKRKPRKPRKP